MRGCRKSLQFFLPVISAARTTNAFFQAGWFVCFLSHFFELPSIKKKRTFCSIRFTGRFILSHKIVLLPAPMIKLCTMSEIGPCIEQQCKAYCISQVPITLSEGCIGIMKANLPPDALHSVWSTCPTWWALSKVSKLALSCQSKSSQISSWDFSGILCFWRNTCVMCYRMLNNPRFSCFVIKFLHFWHFQNLYFWITTSIMCSREGGFSCHLCRLWYERELLLQEKNPSSSILSSDKSRWCL